jgi:alkylation response protein AidB-like acyl-CoA dehydrogenase
MLLDDDLKLIRDQAQRYLAENVGDERLKELLDVVGGFDRPLWDAAVDMGWPAIAAPEEVDGLGLGWTGLAVLAGELGRRTASLPLVPGAVALRAILASPAAADLTEVVAGLVSGERIACLAFGEAGDLAVPKTPALTLSGGRLSGAKAIAPFAAVADLAVVHATGGEGTVLALVDLAQDAVGRRVVPTLDNARAAAGLTFDGAACTVLASGAEAGKAVHDLTALAAAAIAAEQIAAAEAALKLSCDYAHERIAFGQPIGRFQAIKHKLADMYWRIEIARGCLFEAVQDIDAAAPDWTVSAAAARLGALEAAEFTARETIQTHGGLGVTWEAMPHHTYRRSRVLAMELGGQIYWRERLLQDLGHAMPGEG